MTFPIAPTVVPVRTGAGGAVLVGALPAGPAGLGVVGMPGAVAYVDPADPERLAHAVLHDPDRALPAVAAVYGDAVARAVAAAGPSPVEVATLDAPGAELVRRAGIADWLRTCSPDLLPDPLLEIQIGIAAADPDLDTGEEDSAVELLRRHAVRIVRTVQRVRDPDRRGPGMGAVPAGLAELVATAVDAAASVVGIGTRVHADVEHECELLAAVRSFDLPVSALSWADLVDLPQTADRRPAGAGHAGQSAPAARASVDWTQVPRGVLATGEDTVEWAVSDAELVVAVQAAAGAPDSRTLAFRGYVPGRPLPVSRGMLRRTGDGARFTGRARLSDGVRPSDPLVVDVYDVQSRLPPRIGVEGVAAKAERWAVRGVTLLRIGVAADDADQIAASALDEAAAHYGAVVAAHPDSDRRDLALRRQARCVAVRRAVLDRLGQRRQAVAVGRAWRAGEVVTEADVAVPDLDGPGWAPLAAEWALAADPRWWQ